MAILEDQSFQRGWSKNWRASVIRDDNVVRLSLFASAGPARISVLHLAAWMWLGRVSVSATPSCVPTELLR
jgi:hypothetical protein